jgi:hypothetical protein
MTKKNANAIAGLTAALILAASAAATAGDDKIRLSSKTQLSPDQEVATVESDGLGIAIISIKRKFRSAKIRVTYTNLVGEFTRIHLHCAPAGENGPIAIGFVDLVSLANDNSETNKLGSHTVIGRISNNQFPAGGGSCGISNLRQLADAIDAGGIYWNLHTTEFPGGELRGQVEPLSGSGDGEDD